VQEAHELDRAARAAGMRLNVFATLRSPTGLTDVERKRVIARRTAHLGQALQRRGQPHIGMTFFEKRSGGDLHAHHLVHVEHKNIDVIERWADIYDPKPVKRREKLDVPIHARPAVATDIGYVTKQRLPFSPEYEARCPHRRQRGAVIPGKRWTATREALALLETKPEPVAARITPEPMAISETSADAIQLSLFPILPSAHQWSGEQVRELRERIGMTQERLAIRLGLRDRSHIANVERGHDDFSPTRWRLLRHIMEAEGIAA
jgi:DNA-binding transcriptional regulator YiaG